jgi:hypothetical protein
MEEDRKDENDKIEWWNRAERWRIEHNGRGVEDDRKLEGRLEIMKVASGRWKEWWTLTEKDEGGRGWNEWKSMKEEDGRDGWKGRERMKEEEDGRDGRG